MREFRIKVNNEKTYVVKANDYNQAVKTLHSKLRDFDDTKKNINVVREFITNNGGKFSKSKDADAILDFIYKKTGVKNADYGDVLYIIKNYTNVKVEDNKVTDFDLTNFLALKRSLELRIGEEIDFDKLEEYVNKLPKDKNGKKNIDVKEVIKRCIKAKDNAVSDSISKYNGEDAIRTNGFVKIKEDGDWTSYKYNGSDFDGAVFKIHQYNPSLIAFVSNGNRTITVRNKYLNDSADTAQGEIEVLKSFGFDYKDGKWVKESNNNNIIVQPDYHYVSVIGPGDTEKHCKKYQYQSAGMLKKIITSNIKDSSITDTDMKIAEDIIKKYGGNPVGNVMGLQKTRFVGQDEIKNQHDFATDLDKAGYKFYLINGRYRISPKDSSIKDVDWDFANKLKQHSQEEIRNALKYSAPTVYKQYRNGETIQFAGLAGQLTGPEKTKVLKRLGDSYMKDADPVKVEKIIRKEKSALGITYYLFQTKSNSGATIYYEVTDKSYHGEPTYSGGGIISYSLQSANDSLDHNLLSDKLKAKYGEKEGTKRYLRGENDSAIKDKLSTSDANSLVEAYIDKYKYTHSNLPYVNKPKIKIFNSPEEFRDKFLSSHSGYSIYAGGLLNYNGYVVKLFTSAKDGKIESPSADNIFTIFPTTAIKDSANSIKNRISYDDLKRTINKVMEEGNDKDVVNILIGQLAELKKDYETDINNSKLDKEETKRHYGEYKRLVNNYKNSHISKEYTNAVNSFLSAIKDSNNIKNRKSYTIKVGDKQYKVFAESEEEAVDKYIKSKKQ